MSEWFLRDLGEGKRWRYFQTTCDLFHICNTFMKHKEKYNWRCRRKETERERLWQDLSSSRHITHEVLWASIISTDVRGFPSWLLCVSHVAEWLQMAAETFVSVRRLKEGIFPKLQLKCNSYTSWNVRQLPCAYKAKINMMYFQYTIMFCGIYSAVRR